MPKTDIEREVEIMKAAGRSWEDIAKRVDAYFRAGDLVSWALLSRER